MLSRLSFRFFIIVIIFYLSYFAGWRLIGFDRENYISMYEGVINSDTFALKFYFAKDFIYLFFAELNNIFFDDSRYLFTGLIFLSFSIKFLLFKKIKVKNYFLTLIIYVLFLSSVLEFIAFRSALSLSFLLFSIYYREHTYVYLFLILSILSHTSSILPAFCISPFFSNYVNKNKILYLSLIIIPVFLNSYLLSFFPQGDNYISNQQGTWKAMILPIVTLFISNLIFFKFDNILKKNPSDVTLRFIYNSKSVIYSLIFFSIGITPFIVTAATRYLEFVYLLLIIAGISLIRKSYINLIGFLFLLLLLTYLNLVKDLWNNMFNPLNITSP